MESHRKISSIAGDDEIGAGFHGALQHFVVFRITRNRYLLSWSYDYDIFQEILHEARGQLPIQSKAAAA